MQQKWRLAFNSTQHFHAYSVDSWSCSKATFNIIYMWVINNKYCSTVIHRGAWAGHRRYNKVEAFLHLLRIFKKMRYLNSIRPIFNAMRLDVAAYPKAPGWDIAVVIQRHFLNRKAARTCRKVMVISNKVILETHERVKQMAPYQMLFLRNLSAL